MKIKLYSHNYGEHALEPDVLQPILEVVQGTSYEIKKGCGSNLREAFLEEFRRFGWSGAVRIDKDKGITITSTKNGVALCLQTGNMSRFYADLLKLQATYVKGKAKSAIYIVPTKIAARVIGDNIAQYERMTRELESFNKVITMPIVVIGFEGDNKED